MLTWLQLIINTAQASTFMPVAGSAVAAEVDKFYMFLLIISTIASVLVIAGLVYFALKYKRKSMADKTAYISHNNLLEFLWSFIPFVLFIVCFAWGWVIYNDMRSFPKDALEVHVVGQKWSWTFMYKSGRTETNEFTVPVDTPIKFIMTSKDVLHSFFVPGMRTKQDVVPGRYTALGFTPNKEGTFQIFCTEFCGDNHSQMLAKMNVVSKAEYEKWLANDPYKGLSLVDMGKKVFAKCSVCHSVEPDKKLVGPSLFGSFGRKSEFTDGTSAVVDEAYINESIMQPQKKVVKGYPPAMPSFQGQLKQNEISGLIEYIKTLK